ncbi:MAG: hypothetical protein OIF51_17135 [Cellvibrionaceae bacterium]|nr:hypothetical protein [Cellvibrionaceae bacterium]
MRLLLLVTILLTFGCAPLSSNKRIFIGDLEWVKLHPNGPFQSRTLENGTEEILVSNSCGTAEVKYKLHDSGYRQVWMRMGEWCKTPFDINSESHLVFASEDGEIIEYYAIEENVEKNKVVFLLNIGGTKNKDLGHLLKDLETPLFLEDINEDNSKWAEVMSSEGIVKIENKKIYIIRAVYITDVIREYRL